jgi:replicative DNA helicase
MPDALTDFSFRLPPSNVQAEQALLGAILSNNSAYERVADFLRPEHFADRVHGVIYEAISKKIEAGGFVDAVTLKTMFEGSGQLAEVGGPAYIATLLSAMVSIITTGEYGRAVYEAWLRRQLIDFGSDTAAKAFEASPDVNASALLEEAEQKLFAITAGVGSSQDGPVTIGECVRLALEEGEFARENPGATGTSTGLPSLDSAILGLRPAHLIVCGGRPSMGKTSLGRTVALNVSCGQGETTQGQFYDEPDLARPVAYFSLEEHKIDAGAAAVASLARVPVKVLLGGTYTVEEADRIKRAQRRLEQAQLYVIQKPRQTWQSIARDCRRLEQKLRRKLGLVVVDYLQLMPDPVGVKEKRLAVGANAYAMKDLAGDRETTVMLLSQLGRQVDDRPDHRPTMRDLRESGEIEDAADAIVFPYREVRYFEQKRPVKDLDSGETEPGFQARLAEWQAKFNELADQAELIIPKVRRGEAPLHRYMRFDGPATRFRERGW